MGKKVRMPGYQGAKGKRRFPLPLVLTALLGLLLLGALGFLYSRSLTKTQAPLPGMAMDKLPPLPEGGALPGMNQTPPPGGTPLPAVTQDTNQLPQSPPLPATDQQVSRLPQAPPLPAVAQDANQLPQSPPLPAADPPAPPPQRPVTQQTLPPPPPPPASAPAEPPAAGTVTWRWDIYPVDASVLQVHLGDKMSGYSFVSLGVSIYNGSNREVRVDGNSFLLTVDGRTYTTDVWITGSAVVQGMPYLAETELQPGASMTGHTGYMIPQYYQAVSPQWRFRVPAGIKVVRVDP